MKYKNDSFKIAFTGMMFSLILLFQYLETFFDLKMGFVKLNLSIVFILATGFIVGKRWVILLLILRFFIAPTISTYGYTSLGFWSQFALLLYDSLFLIIVYIMIKLFSNIYIAVIVSSIALMLLSPFLNGLLITPVYWKLLHYQSTISLSDAMKSYEYVKPFYFYIPNYWGGMFAAYFVANLIKFSIVSFLFLGLWKVIKMHYEHKPLFSKKYKKNLL